MSEREPPVELRVRVLGTFRVQVGTQVIPDTDWRLQKARALVKLLALTPGHRLARDQVLDRLWPEFEPEAALNNFHYALHIARRALDCAPSGKSARLSALRLAEGTLALAPAGSVFVDADAFEAAAGTARRSKDPRAYASALQLYAGELLPQDRYADWTARPREMLRDLQLDLLLELAKLHLERGQYQRAIDAFVKVVAEEPTHEQAGISLMQLYAAMGQRWKALHEYARLRAALRDELDVEPEATTRQLYADILAGSSGPQFQFGASQVNSPAQLAGVINRHRPLAEGRSLAQRVAWSK